MGCDKLGLVLKGVNKLWNGYVAPGKQPARRVANDCWDETPQKLHPMRCQHC